MAFSLSPIENIEIPIPDGKGGTITLEVPPLDCLDPADVTKMNKQMNDIAEDTPAHLDPNKNPNALVKHMLAYFNPKAKTAIWGLVNRHVAEINNYWNEESGVELGKSGRSTGSSSTAQE